tara:strand:- start:23191 stop:23403 length:213 start_codon:yes stop_codon:yes gene_type:complete
MLKTYIYSFKIECENNDEPNPVHLCEEIQCYLNSNLSYYDDELQEHTNAKVTGYSVKHDQMNPFYAQEDY